MKKFLVENIAQIKRAEVHFGDFTVLVGPQASGKSIFLQLLKLALDAGIIKNEIRKHGYSWKSKADFLNQVLGEGMAGIENNSSLITLDKKRLTFQDLSQKRLTSSEKVFLIPAQRVVTVQEGWPRNFQNYGVLDPFVVKHFSENLRILMEQGLGTGSSNGIFPQEGRMKKAFRDKLNESIFYEGKIELDDSHPKKRIVLNVGNNVLPYMAWSAGQREFMPLLLGLYWLMPASKISKREGIDWVIIEEPEMGLHPNAIQGLLLTFLELVSRGYKVIISTHSPVILEFCWVMNEIKKSGSESDLFELFQVPKQPAIQDIFKNAVSKKLFKTVFFERSNAGVISRDISSLDPSADSEAEQFWGGLSTFSNRVSEVVSNLYGQ